VQLDPIFIEPEQETVFSKTEELATENDVPETILFATESEEFNTDAPKQDMDEPPISFPVTLSWLPDHMGRRAEISDPATALPFTDKPSTKSTKPVILVLPLTLQSPKTEEEDPTIRFPDKVHLLPKDETTVKDTFE
jgi:hypothetical protein